MFFPRYLFQRDFSSKAFKQETKITFFNHETKYFYLNDLSCFCLQCNAFLLGQEQKRLEESIICRRKITVIFLLLSQSQAPYGEIFVYSY